MLTRSRAKGLDKAAHTHTDTHTDTGTGTAEKKVLVLPAFSASLLLRLPRDFLASVFKDYLTLRELVRFDTAMSSREGRAKLLEVLRSGGVVFAKGQEDGGGWIKEACLNWLCDRGVGVRRLRCDGAYRFGHTAEKVVFVCRDSPGLTVLRLSLWNRFGCESFSSSEMAEIGRHCPNVETLDFSYCLDSTKVIVEAAKHMPRLRDVDFSWCSFLGDAALVALSEHCPRRVV